jgi:hypothetical protein
MTKSTSFKLDVPQVIERPLEGNPNKFSGNQVVRSSECCLTCGGNKRLQWLEHIDGRRVIKEVCLYCLTRCHTKRNEEDH